MVLTNHYPGMEGWKGRVTIVTGASAGIGYETAKRLAQLGVVVVGCARNIIAIEVSVHVIAVLHVSMQQLRVLTHYISFPNWWNIIRIIAINVT